MTAPGFYLPRYNWSVRRYPGASEFCLSARLPGDTIATDRRAISAIEDWGRANRRKYKELERNALAAAKLNPTR